MAQLAGLSVERAGKLTSLPAALVRCLAPRSRLSKIPWDTAHMALVGGEVVAVLELGDPSGVLVLCNIDGQALALSGLTPQRVGVWPVSGAGVSADGVLVPTLDVGAALTQFQSSRATAQESAP